jgi:hypothetical protein
MTVNYDGKSFITSDPGEGPIVIICLLLQWSLPVTHFQIWFIAILVFYLIQFTIKV